MSNDQRVWTAWHEAGHALIAIMLIPDFVQYATIVPDGEGADGKLVLDEDKLYTQNSLRLLLAVLLGGVMSERLNGGNPQSENALNDRTSMDAALSVLFCYGDANTDMETAYARAREILTNEAGFLAALKDALLEHGRLDRAALLRLRNGHATGKVYV